MSQPNASLSPLRRLARGSRPGLLPGLVLGTLALSTPAQEPVLEAEPRTEAGAPASEPLQLQLSDALRIALEDNLGLDIERKNTEEALYNAVGSWGAFDPVLSVAGTLTDRESPGVSDLSGANVLEEDSQNLDASLTWPVPTGANLQLQYTRSNDRTNNTFAVFDVSTTDVVTASLTQPLLRGGWRRFATATQRESEVNYQIQQQRERQTLQRLLLDVTNAYWDLVSAREELAVRQLAVRLGEEQQTRDERRLDVGSGTEVDVLQARTNVAQQIEARIQAESTLRVAEDNLRRLLFQKPGQLGEEAYLRWERPIDPTTELPNLEAMDDVERFLGGRNWRTSLERALGERPELWQDRLAIDAAEIRLGRARSERLPQLDLELTASAVGFSEDPADAFEDASSFEFPEYRGGLTFSIPLGNRTASNAERAARAVLRRTRVSYDQRELDVLAEVRTALRDVRYRSESVLAAKTSLELARRQLDAEESRLELGLSTTFQVLEFQQTLAEALSAERAARASYGKAWAALVHAEGALEGPAALDGLDAYKPSGEG